MASHPLDDSYRLVERAERELRTLDGQIATYLDTQPYRLEIKPKHDAHGLEVIPKFSDYPDPEWKVDFGVLGGHLRSALEYIPSHLANPDDPSVSQTQFPIYSAETGYLAKNKRGYTARDRALKGVDPAHWVFFDAQQPYARGDDLETGPLATLAWITNAHKHRQLHPHVVAVEDAIVRVLADGKPDISVEIEGACLKEGVPLFGFAISAQESLGLDYSFTADIAFGDRPLRMRDLWPVVERVREILVSFEPVFGSRVG